MKKTQQVLDIYPCQPRARNYIKQFISNFQKARLSFEEFSLLKRFIEGDRWVQEDVSILIQGRPNGALFLRALHYCARQNRGERYSLILKECLSEIFSQLLP